MHVPRLVSVFALAATLIQPLRAQVAPAAAPAPETPALKLTLTPAYASQYMFRGTRLGGQSFQPTVAAAYGDASVGLWANFPLAKKVPGQSDPEFDFFGTWNFKLNDTATLVPGFTTYVYPRAESANGFYKFTFEPSLALNLSVAGLTLTPKSYYDVVLRGPTWELTAAKTVSLSAPAIDFTFSATAGTFSWRDAVNNTAPRVRNDGDYWSAGVTATHAFSATTSLSLGWMLTAGRDNTFESAGASVDNALAVRRGVFTLAWSWTR